MDKFCRSYQLQTYMPSDAGRCCTLEKPVTELEANVGGHLIMTVCVHQEFTGCHQAGTGVLLQ